MSLRAVFMQHGVAHHARPAQPEDAKPNAEPRAAVVRRVPLSEVLEPAVIDGLSKRLRVLAEAEGLARQLVEDLSLEDVAGCEGLSDAELTAYLFAVQQSARMARGFVPVGWNRQGFCSRCGPVYLPADHPKESSHCPWCRFTRKGKGFIRPPVTCGECLHFKPSAYQPAAGMGSCGLGKVSRCASLPYPHAPRQCRFWLHQSPPEARDVPPCGDVCAKP